MRPRARPPPSSSHLFPRGSGGVFLPFLKGIFFLRHSRGPGKPRPRKAVFPLGAGVGAVQPSNLSPGRSPAPFPRGRGGFLGNKGPCLPRRHWRPPSSSDECPLLRRWPVVYSSSSWPGSSFSVVPSPLGGEAPQLFPVAESDIAPFPEQGCSSPSFILREDISCPLGQEEGRPSPHKPKRRASGEMVAPGRGRGPASFRVRRPDLKTGLPVFFWVWIPCSTL